MMGGGGISGRERPVRLEIKPYFKNSALLKYSEKKPVDFGGKLPVKR